MATTMGVVLPEFVKQAWGSWDRWLAKATAKPPRRRSYWPTLGFLAFVIIALPAGIAAFLIDGWHSDIQKLALAELGVVLGAAAFGDSLASGSLVCDPPAREARHAAAGFSLFGFAIAVVLAAIAVGGAPPEIACPFAVATIGYGSLLCYLAAYPDAKRARPPKIARYAALATLMLWLTGWRIPAGRHGLPATAEQVGKPAP